METVIKIFLCLISWASILRCEGRSLAAEELQADQNHLLQARIIDGEEVGIDLVPYQASIQSTFGDIICGGAIISNRWILSAAHCMTWPTEFLKVVTGTTKWTEPGAEYVVEKKVLHCSYNKPWMHHDIALLRTTVPIVFNQYTQPIALARKNTLKEGDKLTVSGWGSIKTWGRSTDTLRSAEVSYISHETCLKNVKKSAWLGQSNICTDTKSGKGSCSNDSGGPLVYKKKLLFGIINWGEACAVGRPDVYASVPDYYNWITHIMKGGSSC